MSRARLLSGLAAALIVAGSLISIGAGALLLADGQRLLGLAVVGVTVALVGAALLIALMMSQAATTARLAASTKVYARNAAERSSSLLARKPFDPKALVAEDGVVTRAIDTGRVELHALSEEMLVTAVRTRNAVDSVAERLDAASSRLVKATSRRTTMATLDTWFAQDAVREQQREVLAEGLAETLRAELGHAAGTDALVDALRAELARAAGAGGDMSRLIRGENAGLYGLVEGLAEIHRLLDFTAPLPPLGGWAIRADLGAHLVRHVLEHAPQQIMDLGSGVSTILMATACRSNGSGHVLSVDHDEVYASQTRALLARHGLDDWATVVTAPLVPVTVDDEQFHWYDLSQVSLPDAVDMLLVDGPPGPTGPMARYPAVPRLRDRLAPGGVVLLDDARRPEEEETAARWADLLGARPVVDLGHLVGTAMLRVPAGS